jgi:hypothetical protein
MTEHYSDDQNANNQNGQQPELEISEEDFAEDPDEEQVSFNQLHDLANQAQSKGLIAGHGYAKGQYEIICQGQIVLLPVDEAMQYLQELLGE